MRTYLSSTELPKELEGFAGGMGFKSIQSITESEVGFNSFDYDVKGYISEHVNSVHYAEVIDEDGNAEYASGTLDEMQKWVTETVYSICKSQEEHIVLEIATFKNSVYVLSDTKFDSFKAAEFLRDNYPDHENIELVEENETSVDKHYDSNYCMVFHKKNS